jgi:hypothetical protein
VIAVVWGLVVLGAVEPALLMEFAHMYTQVVALKKNCFLFLVLQLFAVTVHSVPTAKRKTLDYLMAKELSFRQERIELLSLASRQHSSRFVCA